MIGKRNNTTQTKTVIRQYCTKCTARKIQKIFTGNNAINTVRHASFKKRQLAETVIQNVDFKKVHLADFTNLSIPICLIEIISVQEICIIRP